MDFTIEQETRQRLRSARTHHLMGDFPAARVGYTLALEVDPLCCDARVGLAQLHYTKKRYDEALQTLRDAPAATRLTAEYHYLLGRLYEERGEPERTRQHFGRVLELSEDYVEVHQFSAREELNGPFYLEFIAAMHERLRPRVYLEIGIARGDAFLLAKDSGLSIGVDPNPRIERALPANMRIDARPSDAFFADPRSRALLTQNPIEMCFVDGHHEFSQALRDFFNAERFCRREAVILVHDAVPLNEATATAARRTLFWSGDVWKMIVALKAACPDLSVEVLPCPPTGLAVVTNLHPGRNLGEAEQRGIVERFGAMTYGDVAAEKFKQLNVISDWQRLLSEFTPLPWRPV